MGKDGKRAQVIQRGLGRGSVKCLQAWAPESGSLDSDLASY